MILVLCGVLIVLALSLLWPFAKGVFRFGPLHVADLALTLAVGAGVLVLLEGLKRFWRQVSTQPGS